MSECPAHVFVGGKPDDSESTEIPVINDGIETHIRKNGPLDINKLTDVYFPIEWQGQRYDNVVNELRPAEENEWDEAIVQIKNPTTGEFETVHDGYVMSVGGGTNGTIERRMRVGGVAQLLDAVPASVTFDAPDPVIVFQHIIGELMDAQPVFDAIGFSTQGANFVDGQAFAGDVEANYEDTQFTADEHTLRDVLDWIIETLDGHVYFRPPHPNGFDVDLIFEYREDPSPPTLYPSHIAEDNDSITADTSVIKNNAMFEIAPYNAVTAHGESQYEEPEDDEGLGGEELFPQARVYHDKLYNMAGGTILQPTVEQVSGRSLDEVEQRAKNTLKDILSNSGVGTIRTTPLPQAEPYKRFESQPACAGNVDGDVASFTYEIQEVTHHVSATADDDTPLAYTELKVAPDASADQITVDVSRMQEA